MERMYQEYRDIAEFFIVYISEAHAADDKYPVKYAKDLGIKEHTSYGERCSVASRLQKDKKLNIPCLIDGMENVVATAYKAWPDRLFLVRKDGKLAVAAKRGPWGFRPAVNAAKKWLAAYKETGKEPEPAPASDDGPDLGQMQGDLSRAYREGNYPEALAVARKLHRLDPESVGTMYNIACMHSLLGDTGNAYAWLEKAIKAGYSDADHLLADEDFKAIRGQERFKKLVKQLRGKSDRGALVPTAP